MSEKGVYGWLAYIPDVEAQGNSYRCDRCGVETETKTRMWVHRSGIMLTRCDIQRIKNWLLDVFK